MNINKPHHTIIYAVTNETYGEYRVESLFSSEKLAEEYIQTADKVNGSYSSRRVEKFILDEPREEWVKTEVRMSKNGDVIEVWQSVYDDRGFQCYDGNRNIVYSVATMK